MNLFDLVVLRWLNGFVGRNHELDVAAALLTKYAPVVFAVVFLFFFIARPDERMRRTILLSVLSGALALVGSVIIASLVYRPRPFTVLPPEQLRLLIPHAADSSFPSDHAMGSAGFAVGMWRSPGWAARVVFTITALLVGLSRVFVGIHWPSDILASFVLGGLFAQATFALARPLSPVLNWILRLANSLQGPRQTPRRPRRR